MAAARAGVSTLLVAAVGQDEAGGSALQELAAAGVDVSRCLSLPDGATGIALIAVDRVGANQIAVAPGADAASRADLVEDALATTLAGARDGMPSRERTDALLGSPSVEELRQRPL